ncbi:MAG: phenylacetate--CoA ligase family protein [Kofleriaceae bacterium]
MRGRPTVPLLHYLERTERKTLGELRDLQLGLLRRLLRHAYHHTVHYRQVLDELGMSPDIDSLDALARLPLLDRDTVCLSLDARTAMAPPRWVVKKTTSGTTGQPVVVKYNAESRYWRDATRWRGYGWAGYRIGMRALHYWGCGPTPESWVKRKKIALDRILKRDLYLDSTPRGEQALLEVVQQLRRYDPQVLVAYSAGAAALAQFVLDRGLRDWPEIPVLVGAERLWPHDREVIEAAFGPAFETYGCREVMLISSECEAHDGMHTSMETMIVEVVVREPDGTVRVARPGESGEIAITDLHNLACPMIRYITGDLAVQRDDAPCRCGRGLARIGPIEGRVTETLRDGLGRPVGGLVFNILFGVLDHVARKFQVIQKLDGRVIMKVVPNGGDRLPDKARRAIDEFASRYLPEATFELQYVDDIPLTAAGKRKVVVVEKPG